MSTKEQASEISVPMNSAVTHCDGLPRRCNNNYTFNAEYKGGRARRQVLAVVDRRDHRLYRPDRPWPASERTVSTFPDSIATLLPLLPSASGRCMMETRRHGTDDRRSAVIRPRVVVFIRRGIPMRRRGTTSRELSVAEPGPAP